MPTDTLDTVIKIAKVSKYLAAYDEANSIATKGGAIQFELSKILFSIIEDLEWAIANGASNASIDKTANYLMWLCGSYTVKARTIINRLAPVISLGNAPVITLQPISGNVTSGGTITLTVNVTGTLPITYQWQKLTNSVWGNITGATSSTFTKTNVTISDAGSYRVIATNQYGTATSNAADITVVAQSLTAYYWYGATDPFPALNGGTDALVYQTSAPFTTNQSISIPLPLAGQVNMFGVVKVPIGQSVKTTWYNTALNNGQIPDAIWRDKITIGQFDYYVTRVEYTYDSLLPLIFS
jgi:hypothetical protein